MLPLSILLLIVLSVLSVDMIGVSAVVSPYIAVIPQSTVDTDLTPGMTYTVSIYTDYVGTSAFLDYIWAYQFALSYNPSVLNGTEVVNGDLIAGEGTQFIAGPFDNIAGELSLTVGTYRVGGEVTSGPGTLANVTFIVVGEGASDIAIGSDSSLVGWDWFGEPPDYDIINAAEQPDQIQHGYFSNVPPVTQYDLTIGVVGSGTTDPVIGVHTYDEGTLVPVTATAAAGWTFDHWELDGSPAGSDNPIDVTMNADQALIAYFVGMPGAIAGRVTDSSTGDPIEGANVTANGYSDTTDADGHYIVSDVPAGTYNVIASANGYPTSSQTNITVVAGETTTVNLELTPTQPLNILTYVGVAAAAIIIIAGIAVYILKIRKPT
jgi:hypothetical protein